MMIHSLRLLVSISLIAVLVGCSQQATDKTPPTVSLSADKSSLTDAGSITLTADATDDKGVTRVEFYKGEIKLGEDSSNPYTLKVDLGADHNGDNSFTAKAFDAAGKNTTSSPVNVSVDIDNVPPKISLEASSSNLNSAGNIILTANATDNKGVVKVEFFKGSEKLGEDTTAEDGFSFVVNLAAEDNGSPKYTAKAYDKKGNASSSAEVSVNVDIDVIAPTIVLSSNQTTLTAAGSATLIADASDNKGVVKVELFEGANKLSEDTEAPFSFDLNFTAAENGTYTYSAKAYDAKGNSATSGSITISVDIDITNPTVALTSNKTTLTVAGTATLTAVASDNTGVTRVEFFEGTNKLGDDTEAPFSFDLNFTAANNGSHTYRAKAFDAKGNSATSGEVVITVDIDVTLPVVFLEADQESVSKPSSVTLTADASDDKAIVKVEFFEGATRLGEDTVAPYTWELNFTAAHTGTYIYTAKATDTSGNEVVSDPFDILVDIRGYLALTVSGLSALTNGSVVVSGPENYSLHLSNSTTLDNLKPGTYTITPSDVDEGNYSYSATASTVEVNRGSTANATVSYAAINGAMMVNISGLPVETAGSVAVSGPDGYSQNLSETTVLSKLKPGTYTLTPSNVDSGNYSYSAATLAVNVVKGSLGVGMVSYAAITGALRVTISGLPDGTAGSVAVSGPDGYSQNLSATTSLSKLKPGVYTLTPSNVDSGNYNHSATGSPAIVVAGNLSANTVNYSATNGALSVTISGLPNGTGGSVLVTGPNNYSQNLTTTTTLKKLSAGSYTVIAPTVSGYSSTVTGSPATVTVGNTAAASATLTYLNSPGSLDINFDSDGKVTTDFAFKADLAYSVALQSDGKIVVAGYSNNGNDDFAVARYNPNGSLDTSFGTGGKLTTAIGNSTDQANSIALQTDGKIVVAGYSYNGSNDDFAVVRYNSDGSLDTSFGTGGKLTTAIGTFNDRAYSVAIQDDGKIVVAGYSHSSNEDFAVVRYHSDGSLDPNFGTGGKVVTAIGSSQERASSMTLQSDGKIVVTGYSRTNNNDDIAVVRYNSDGSLDTSFDTDGKLTTAIGVGNDYANAIAVQDDGKIVVAGYSFIGVRTKNRG